MSTAQKTLIDAIRRIALDSEALASALGDLQKRGVIDGIKTTLGGYNELQDDCCTEGDGNPADEDITDELPDISGDAPPSVPGIGEEDVEGDTGWTDCETGEAISFAPGGFPRPETCKDCSRPDPYWEPGRYWVAFGPLEDFCGSAQGETAQSVLAQVYDCLLGGATENAPVDARLSPSGPDNHLWRIQVQRRYDLVWLDSIYSIGHLPCAGSEYASADFCQLTEPPIIDDCQDWESDSTTSYTLVNGCIVASRCDPDASAQAQSCNECITICNEDGEERRVCAIGNGQWILYDPSGEHKGGRYDATGERQEILDAGETGGYLPSERFTQG